MKSNLFFIGSVTGTGKCDMRDVLCDWQPLSLPGIDGNTGMDRRRMTFLFLLSIDLERLFGWSSGPSQPLDRYKPTVTVMKGKFQVFKAFINICVQMLDKQEFVWPA
jgi:hypothetical protein